MPTATADSTESTLVIYDTAAVIAWLEQADPDTVDAYVWADPGPPSDTGGPSGGSDGPPTSGAQWSRPSPPT